MSGERQERQLAGIRKEFTTQSSRLLVRSAYVKGGLSEERGIQLADAINRIQAANIAGNRSGFDESLTSLSGIIKDPAIRDNPELADLGEALTKLARDLWNARNGNKIE